MQNTIWRWRDAAAVFSGGCLGGAARYGVGLWFHDGTNLLGTTAVNLTGSFFIGPHHVWFSVVCGPTGLAHFGARNRLCGGVHYFFHFVCKRGGACCKPAAFVAVMLVVNLVGGLAAAMLGYWVATAWAERYNKW